MFNYIHTGIISLFTMILVISCSTFKEVTVQKLNREIVNQQMEYDSYWCAIDAFEFEIAESLATSKEEVLLAGCLNNVENGDFKTSEELLIELYFSADDTLISDRAYQTLSNYYFFDSRWTDVLKISSFKGEKDNILAHAFSTLPEERIDFSEYSIIVPIEINSSGSPIVEVIINGVKQKFWIDTGAGLSVISSDMAEECGVIPILEDISKAGTATGKNVDVIPAVINNLSLGELTISNLPVIIISEEDLRFSLLGFITLMKIDGIIGWDVLHKLDFEIDYKNEYMIINKPVRKESNVRNLFWFGYPFVRAYTEDGIPIYFGLDTGAEFTSVGEGLFNKLKINEVYNTEKKIGGAGGWETIQSKVIPKLSIILDKHLFNFQEVPSVLREVTFLGKLDGQFGSDIAKDCKISVDYTNGTFSIIKDPPMIEKLKRSFND